MSIYTACSPANPYIIPVLEICHVMELYINFIIIIYVAHTNIGIDTERKKSKEKSANHMILF